MISLSMAALVDGYFLGNLVGPEALAAVNLVMPVHAVFFGIGLIFTVGGSVRAGTALGRGDPRRARAIFRTTMSALAIVSVILTLLVVLLRGPLLHLLGGRGALYGPAQEYLLSTIPFFFFSITATALAYFARLTRHAVRASVALALVGVVNIGLDALLVGHLSLGISGAGIASGLSYVAGFILLVPVFRRRPGTLYLAKETVGMRTLGRMALNGLPEFLAEATAGLSMLLFNRVILRYEGTAGVAAFTVINALYWFALMASYAFSDTLQPLISTSRGAGNTQRVRVFLKLGLTLTGVLGLLFALLLLIIPGQLLGLFLAPGSPEGAHALVFAAQVWPAFLLAGINILLSSYFTSMELPLQSLAVTLARGLIFPMLFLLLLPPLLGARGIGLAIPLGEAAAFALTLLVFTRHRRRRAVLAPAA